MITTFPIAASGTKTRSGVWDYVSASRLNLWLKCPLAWKLRYLDGITSPTTPSMFIGKQTHQALETWYRHRQIGAAISADDVLGRLDLDWDGNVAAEHLSFDNAEDERACRRQTAGLVRAYLSQISPDEPRPMAVETSLEAPLVDPQTSEDLGIPLVGVVDLVLPEQAGPRIVDFKTAARGGELLEVTHEVQLSGYAYLFRHTSNQHEADLEIRSLVKTKTPKIETHRYAAREEKHFRRLFAVIRAYLDDLDRGRFVFCPGLGCTSCDYLNSRCREWCG